MILLPLLLALQTTPVQPMPKSTALPPPGTEEGAVIAPVTRLFTGIAAKDSARILAEVRPEGRATVAVEQADGSRAIRGSSWTEFAQRIKPGGPSFEERLTGTPAVEIDGDIAMLWASYVFLLGGKPHHCGINHFDMVREGGSWKILNVTWTQRTTGCTAS